MKKFLCLMLSLALALSICSAFAFVLGPSSTVTAGTNSALNITKFYATYDATNLLSGVRLYSGIVDRTDDAFAKNALIQFAVEFEVLNALVPANNIDTANKKDAGTATITFSSDTVDLSVNQYAGQMALYADGGYELVNAVSVINNAASQGAVYDKTNKTLTVKVDFTQGGTVSAPNAITVNGANVAGFDDEGIQISAPSSYKEASSTYTLIFSGVTTGEITAQGAVTMKTGYSDTNSIFGAVTAAKSDTAAASTIPNAVILTRNGRSYLIEKVTAKWDVTTANYAASFANPTTAIGYKVTLGTSAPYGSVNYGSLVYDTPIAQFDTEVVTYNLPGNDEINGMDVEGYGVSLGLVDLMSTDDAADDLKVFKTVLNDGSTVYLRQDGSKAFATSDGLLAAFETAMDDLGFSTAVGYTYKLTDANFTTAASYAEVRSATYNNGTVVPIEPEEDDDATDVDEPTEEEPIEDEEDPDIEEEPIDEEDPDIDEEPIEDEPLDDEDEAPRTGDFAASAALLLSLTAAAAAAALGFVFKKARG